MAIVQGLNQHGVSRFGDSGSLKIKAGTLALVDVHSKVCHRLKDVMAMLTFWCCIHTVSGHQEGDVASTRRSRDRIRYRGLLREPTRLHQVELLSNRAEMFLDNRLAAQRAVVRWSACKL